MLLKKRFKYLIGFVGILMILFIAGCGNSKETNQNKEQTQSTNLVGVYKIDDMYSKNDDGTVQPSYWYFKKDGKLLRCTPEADSIKDDDSYWYGEAMRGTWKSLGNDEYQLKFHNVYNTDHFTIKAKVDGKRLTTYPTPKSAKYEWDKDTNTKIDMTYNDFMDMFNKAKESEQEDIKENGYDEPDNDGSDDSSTSDSDSDNTKTVGVLILADAQGGLDKIEDTDVEYIIMPKDNTYEIGLGTKDSTLEYTIDGDKVTFTDGGLDYSESSRKTLSINDLKKKYYSSSDDKSTVDDIASDANVTDMSNE
jgi:hypothetical protein